MKCVRLWLAALAGLALAAHGEAASARSASVSPPAQARMASNVRELARQIGFKGAVLIGNQDQVFVAEGFGSGKAERSPQLSPAQVWPWASVTKQVVATMVMQQVAKGRIALDQPASEYLPALGDNVTAPTVRQLLQHRAGLRNPDDSPPDSQGSPNFYSDGPSGLDWCLAGRAAPGGNWRYNNCDYILLGALLEQVTGKSFASLLARDIMRPSQSRMFLFDRAGAVGGMKGTIDGRSTVPFRGNQVQAPLAYRRQLIRYGTAGALVGNAYSLWAFDRALMKGTLLPAAQRDEMWRGDPALGYMALGQWAFTAPVKGCAAPVRIIERRGGIGNFQARNLILPDLGLIVIAFTDRGEAEFDFGEIWTGKGFAHDLLGLACAGSAK